MHGPMNVKLYSIVFLVLKRNLQLPSFILSYNRMSKSLRYAEACKLLLLLAIFCTTTPVKYACFFDLYERLIKILERNQRHFRISLFCDATA